MTPNPWPTLAAKAGRRCVMSQTIDEATLDAETERQCRIIFPMIARLLTGREMMAIDYGCGAGRFTGPLADAAACPTVGFDPCLELLDLAPPHPSVQYAGMEPEQFFMRGRAGSWRFDVIFAAMVLGNPGTDATELAADLVSLLAPDGLVVLLDHMPNTPPEGRWWRYLPQSHYQMIFAAAGVTLNRIGSVMQLDNEVTILAGRRE